MLTSKVFGAVSIALSTILFVYDIHEWSTNRQLLLRVINFVKNIMMIRSGYSPQIAQIALKLDILSSSAHFNHHGTRAGKTVSNSLGIAGGVLLLIPTPVTMITGASILGGALVSGLSSFVFDFTRNYRASLRDAGVEYLNEDNEQSEISEIFRATVRALFFKLNICSPQDLDPRDMELVIAGLKHAENSELKQLWTLVENEGCKGGLFYKETPSPVLLLEGSKD